jgi:hypothetical protein
MVLPELPVALQLSTRLGRDMMLIVAIEFA